MRRAATIPTTPNEWLDEIARAYHDAADAIPVARWMGQRVRKRELHLIASDVALKFRGIKPTREARRKATDAALSSYVATSAANPDPLPGQLAFAFCYLASHVGLDLVSIPEVDEAMEYIESHRGRLSRAIRATRGAECVPRLAAQPRRRR